MSVPGFLAPGDDELCICTTGNLTSHPNLRIMDPWLKGFITISIAASLINGWFHQIVILAVLWLVFSAGREFGK